MSQIKVLASFNQKKCLFSLEALEGENKDRVIAYEEEIILRECKFSKNKDKTAGVIGIWDSKLRDVNQAVRQYFGDEEDLIDGNGYEYSPSYFGELIRYDIVLKHYVVIHDEDGISGMSWETRSDIENDENLKQKALDNAAIIYLAIDEEYCEDVNDMKGIAFHWRRKKEALSIRRKIQEAKVNDLSKLEPLDLNSKIQGQTVEQCPKCEGVGVVTYPCDECGGDPDQIGGTGCSKCGGDGYIEMECPTCDGKGETKGSSAVDY
jgi:hypothetical protein